MIRKAVVSDAKLILPDPYSSIVFNAHYEDVFELFDDNYFDWAVCDIPYGINVGNMAYLKEVRKMVKQKNGNSLNPNRNKKVHAFTDWDKETPPQSYYDGLKRISRNQIIFGADYAGWTGLGSGRIKWDKGVAEGMSFGRYEYAYCSAIEDEWELPLLFTGMMQAKSLSEPMVQQGNKKLNEKRIHPCHKPVMLYDAIFRKFGITKMKVLDSHVGGGSSRITADRFDCQYVGAEINPTYFKDHEQRWRNYKAKLELSLGY